MQVIVNVIRYFLHAERHALCVKVCYDDLVLDLKRLFESLGMGDEKQSWMHAERLFRSHLLVDIWEMVESSYRGRESSGERLGLESAEDEHISRSRPSFATVVICDQWTRDIYNTYISWSVPAISLPLSFLRPTTLYNQRESYSTIERLLESNILQARQKASNLCYRHKSLFLSLSETCVSLSSFPLS